MIESKAKKVKKLSTGVSKKKIKKGDVSSSSKNFGAEERNQEDFLDSESLALFSQISFWSSGRKGSSKFCIDFLGLSYLENSFLLKIYL